MAYVHTGSGLCLPNMILPNPYANVLIHSQPPPHSTTGRSRRARLPSSHHSSQKQFRGVRSMKELTEAANMAASRARFEAGRSFELDDDLEFCPGLLTEDDLLFITPASSDRSSMSSTSPDASPTQHQVQPTTAALHLQQQLQQQPTPAVAAPPVSSSPAHNTAPFQHLATPTTKIYQPSALRARSAIPIVNPTTGMRLPSPPQSISPGMGNPARRW